jgi:hypothetical protein
MFESSFVDGYKEGETIGEKKGEAKTVSANGT